MFRKVFTLNPHELRSVTKPSLQLFSCSSLLGRVGTGSRVGVHVPEGTRLSSTRGPGLVFHVSQGSTCRRVPQPDPGVLAREGGHTSHRDTEIAFVSFLPNFIFVDIPLFPWSFLFCFFFHFHHYYCPHYFL